MDKLKRSKNRALAAAIILTVLLVAGIPAIPLGFTSGYIAVGIVGIVFTVIGFYGCPISWTAYANYAPLMRVVYAIEKEGLRTVPELSAHLRRSEKDVTAAISKAIDKMYLENYLFDGKTLTPNKKSAAATKIFPSKCPSCGAPLPPAASQSNHIRCPYCDTTINRFN